DGTSLDGLSRCDVSILETLFGRLPAVTGGLGLPLSTAQSPKSGGRRVLQGACEEWGSSRDPDGERTGPCGAFASLRTRGGQPPATWSSSRAWALWSAHTAATWSQEELSVARSGHG